MASQTARHRVQRPLEPCEFDTVVSLLRRHKLMIISHWSPHPCSFFIFLHYYSHSEREPTRAAVPTFIVQNSITVFLFCLSLSIPFIQNLTSAFIFHNSFSQSEERAYVHFTLCSGWLCRGLKGSTDIRDIKSWWFNTMIWEQNSTSAWLSFACSSSLFKLLFYHHGQIEAAVCYAAIQHWVPKRNPKSVRES